MRASGAGDRLAEGVAASPRAVQRWTVAALFAFLVITLLVAFDATLAWLDRPIADWVRSGIPADVRIRWFEDALSWPGDDLVRNTVLLTTVVGLLVLRAWWSAALAFLSGGLATASTFALKEWMGRPRPAGSTGSFAYPSGHATLAVVAFGLAVFLLWDAWRSRRPRAESARALERVSRWLVGALVLVVGIARVLGGVHWPTDVLGGWALGSFFVAATLWLRDAAPAWGAALRRRRFKEIS